MEESNVQPVRCPVTVCGDIHGQFVRLLYRSCVRLATPLTILLVSSLLILTTFLRFHATMERV